LEAMSLLVAAVEAGSLSAAGRRLGIPLPSVSRKIADLEAHLGARLLVRTTRKLTPTDAGAAYIEACRRLLGEVEETERAVKGEYTEPRGALTMTAPLVFGRLHVLPVVSAFLSRFPDITVRLIQRLTHSLGLNSIIVSNHGGRQLDGAVPALEMLPEVVDAVGGRLTVLFDSGVRTGADVMKALCLGAKAVLVGRPVIYGLGIAGREGARHVLAGLLADLDQSMGLACVKSVKEMNRGMLRRVRYGGDIKSSL